MDIRPMVKDLAKRPVNDVDLLMLRIVTVEGRWDAIKMHLMQRAIVAVLRETKGNQCEAARKLGLHRNTLNRIREGRPDAA